MRRSKATIIDGIRWGKCKDCLQDPIKLYRRWNLCQPCYREQANQRNKKKVFKIRECLTCGEVCRTTGTQCKKCSLARQRQYNSVWKVKRKDDSKNQIVRNEYLQARIKLADGSNILTERGHLTKNQIQLLIQQGFDFILVENWSQILKQL